MIQGEIDETAKVAVANRFWFWFLRIDIVDTVHSQRTGLLIEKSSGLWFQNVPRIDGQIDRKKFYSDWTYNFIALCLKCFQLPILSMEQICTNTNTQPCFNDAIITILYNDACVLTNVLSCSGIWKSHSWKHACCCQVLQQSYHRATSTVFWRLLFLPFHTTSMVHRNGNTNIFHKSVVYQLLSSCVKTL